MNVARVAAPMTIEDFEAMKKNDRFNYELIDGIVMMSPSPSKRHQWIASTLVIAIGEKLRSTDCKVLYEYDITCNGNIYKPDILIFCDPEAELPEIIFEILSPSTKRTDLITKAVKYEEAGIKEYWIIDPKAQMVILHDYVDQVTETYTLGDTIQSQARPEIVLSVADIFA